MNTVKNKRRPGGQFGERPHVWKSGPDPVDHKKYIQWIRQKAQANFRGEVWDLDFETWKAVWGELWHNRGRSADDYCMTKIDYDQPWCRDNVIIVQRKIHVHRQGNCLPRDLKQQRKHSK